jgi:hypothetical protein
MHAKNHTKLNTDETVIISRNEQLNNPLSSLTTRSEDRNCAIARFFKKIKKPIPIAVAEESSLSYCHIDAFWIVMDSLTRRL